VIYLSREYSVVLRIDGQLSSSVNSAIRQATANLRGLGQNARQATAQVSRQTENLQRQLSRATGLQNFRQLENTIRQTVPQLSQMRQNASRLQQEFQAQERAVASYKQSLQRLRDVRAQTTDRTQYRILGEQIRQANAELRRQEQSLRQARSNYNQQNSAIDRATSSLQRQQAQLRALHSALREAGAGARDFQQSERQLQEQVDRTNQRLTRQQNADAARGRMNEASQNLSNAYGNFQGSIDTAKSIMSPFTSAIDDAVTFEKKLSELKSISQMDLLSSGRVEEANRNMALLKAQAKELGRTTTKTSNEVADAQIYMSRTGMQTNDILKVTPTLLKLATSQNMDFGQAADIATNIMMAFGHSTKDLAHDANVLAYATTHSNSNLSQLGESMKYAAPVAKQFGSSIEETAAMLGFMHDAGIQGSMAGTSLRQTMLRLTAPPKKATKAMEENGITVADCAKEWQMANDIAKQYGVTLDGTLKPGQQMASVIEQIDKNMSGLSSHEKMAAFSAITGVNAVSGAMNVFDKGAEALKKQTEALRKSDGTLDIMYDVSTDNTWGAEQGFLSAREALSQSVGDVFLPAMTEAYKALTKLTQGLDDFVNKHQTAVQWAGLLAAAVAAVTFAVGGAALAMAAFGFISAAVGAIVASPFVMAVASVVAVGTAIYAVISIIGAVIDAIPQMAQALSNAWNDPRGAVKGFSELAKSLIDDAVNYVVDRWETMKQALSHPIDAIINFMDHGDVIGGNVRSGESIRQQSEAHQAISASVSSGSGGIGAINQQISQIDTSQAQAGLDAVGQAASEAANTQQNFAQAGQGAQELQTNLQNAVNEVQNLQTNFQGTGTEIQNLQNNAVGANTEIQNLQNNSQTAAPQIQGVGESALGATSPIQQAGQAAGNSAGQFSQLGSAAGAAATALQNAASRIANLKITAPTVTAAPVASNASGGIYKQGAFLTTFAEKSPEAAIPLDNSKRAKDLWTQAGQALGMIEGNKPAETSPNTSVAEKIYAKRVEEVKQRAERQKATAKPESIPQTKPESIPKPPQPEKPEKTEQTKPEIKGDLLPDEKAELQRAAMEWAAGKIPTLKPPTETSTPEYKKRYENNKKIAEAIKYLPQTPQNKIPQKSSQKSSRGGSIFSTKPRSSASRQNNLPMTQTQPRQLDSGIGNIFSGKVKTPKIDSGNIFGNIGKIFGIGDKVAGNNLNLPKLPALTKSSDVGEMLGDLSAFELPHRQNTNNSTPSITVNITIQGNADSDTMRTAGQVLAVDLKKELDSWWRDKQHNEVRSSFV